MTSHTHYQAKSEASIFEPLGGSTEPWVVALSSLRVWNE